MYWMFKIENYNVALILLVLCVAHKPPALARLAVHAKPLRTLKLSVIWPR